jgi:hypothetical protein
MHIKPTDAAPRTFPHCSTDGGPFGVYAPLLLRNGYSPVPIEPGSKRPLAALGDWSRLRDVPLIEAEIATITAEYPNAGLGVAGGYHGLVPIDFDTEDREILATVNSVLPDAIVAKRGRRGATAFFRDPPGSITARKFKGHDGSMLLEVLVTGQTVIPPTAHPETGEPYIWLTDNTLFDVCIDELPQLPSSMSGQTFIERLEAVLQPWLAPKDCMRKLNGAAASTSPDQVSASPPWSPATRAVQGRGHVQGRAQPRCLPRRLQARQVCSPRGVDSGRGGKCTP